MPRALFSLFFFLALAAPAAADVALTLPAYETMLASGSLGGFIKWTGWYEVDGTTAIAYAVPYQSWPQEMKDELHAYLNSYEEGVNPAGAAPPEPMGDKAATAVHAASAWYGQEATRKMFLVQVAHSLWAEAHGYGALPLAALIAKPAGETTVTTPMGTTHVLDWMFNSKYLFKLDPDKGYFLDHKTGGSVIPWNPKYCYDFLMSLYLSKPLHPVEASQAWSEPSPSIKVKVSTAVLLSPTASIYILTEWVRKNLLHIYVAGGEVLKTPLANPHDYLEAVYGYRGLPPVDRLILPAKGKMRITLGCWGTTSFYQAVLRSINLPVVTYYNSGANAVEDPANACSPEGDSHNLPHFFYDGTRLSHGDDPYNQPVRFAQLASGVNVLGDIEDLFFTESTWKTRMVNPIPQCDPADPNCTKKMQRCFNRLLNLTAFASKFRNFKLMEYLCDQTPQNNPLDVFLKTGDPNGTTPMPFPKPLVGDARRKHLVDRLTKQVKDLGGGDFEQGCQACREKVFEQNSPPCPGPAYYSKYLKADGKPDYDRCTRCAYAELFQDKHPIVLTAADCPGYNIK